jgi:EmrB/QacA subfamily drug resistance transporter
VAITGQLMVMLDIAVVNVAIPVIRSDLGFSAPGVQWVASAYTLTFAGFLLVGGRAADLLGRRRVYSAGLAVFTLSSLAAGLAYFPAMLIAARACQGFGAALLSPATLTILVTDLKGKRQSRAIGAWASTSGVGGGLGVLLGGLMTQELSWRWVFIINVPVGVIIFVIAWTVLGHDPDVKSLRDLDLAGAVVITAAMVTLIFTLIHAGTSTWASALTIAAAIGAVLLFAGFWQIESRLARFPLIPPGTLRGSVSITANLTVLLLYCVVISPWFLLSYYMQTVLGYGPLQTGLAFLPQAVVIALTSNVTSHLVARHDPRAFLVAGPLLAVAGLLVVWRATVHGSGGYLVAVLCPLILLGLAIGCTLPSATILATANADPRAPGFASGLLNSSRQFGGALGLAILFTIGTQQDGGFHSAPTGYPTAALVGVGIAVLATAVAASAAMRSGATGGQFRLLCRIARDRNAGHADRAACTWMAGRGSTVRVGGSESDPGHSLAVGVPDDLGIGRPARRRGQPRPNRVSARLAPAGLSRVHSP